MQYCGCPLHDRMTVSDQLHQLPAIAWYCEEQWSSANMTHCDFKIKQIPCYINELEFGWVLTQLHLAYQLVRTYALQQVCVSRE